MTEHKTLPPDDPRHFADPRLIQEMAAAEARLATLEAQGAPADEIARARVEVDALHRYDSVFTKPESQPKE